ncbi:MAG: filamentous hemagglutinin N-terminal domain-containing protein [Scytonema sp. PMC 1069.18]|nr:filamentous hemagglutinin N-terminal domain-containing protein [Scytonema sp. PMC 1069.18]MEC4885499.1 filamentous hemagglutinin N-terminal domain-containing protein [Scytonema sp. PMC 1070.18]
MLGKHTHWHWFFGITMGSLNAFWCSYAIAQITPDSTLGAESSVVTPDVVIKGIPSEQIDGGAIRGTNLFHSFQQFNINAARGAYFSNPTGIENILSRVTGGNPSNILGTLGVLGNANLFFINPNGIIFGPNASLDVGGSFVATTANAIQFGDLGFFSATNPNAPPLLTINPSALLFNQIAAPIENRSRADAGADSSGNTGYFGLRVPNGQSLLLVGGDLKADGGGMVAFGGRIELGAVAGTGTVGLNLDRNNLSLNFPETLPRANVSLTNEAGFNVAAGGGGNIVITAENIELLEGSSLNAGILSDNGSVDALAGDINLDATESVTITNNSSIGNLVNSEALGNSGNINIQARSLFVTNGGIIGSATFGEGNAGSVNIFAVDTISLNPGDSDSFIVSNVLSDGVGNSGGINITTGVLEVKNGFQIQSVTVGQGNAGRIEIKARDTVSLSGQGRSVIQNDVGFGGVGDSAGIRIETGSLFLSDKAVITSNVSGRGNSGGVEIVARDLVSLDDPGELTFGGQAGTLILSRVNDGAVGNSGDINITTGSLRASNSQITTSTSGEGNSGSVIIEARNQVVLLRSTDIFTEVTCPCETESGIGGLGNGGDIRIKTASLFLDGGSNLRGDTESRGNAGNIIIEARDSVTFSGSSDLFTSGAFTQVEPEAVGRGGDISITTGTLSLSGDQEINTRTQGQGDAGNIFIKADSIVLTDPGVRIISGATQQGRLAGTSGNGGDISITAGSLRITNRAQVSANTEIKGFAGDININMSRLTLDNRGTIKSESAADADGGNISLNIRDLLLMRHNSQISATAGTAEAGGNGGNITINAPNGFVVSVRNENTDITANAFDGRGGEIRINSSGLFNFEQRDRKDLARELGTTEPNQLNPQRLQTNDITAFSQNNPTLEGQININAPDVDQNLGLIELPSVLADASNVIDTGCAAFAGEGSEFIITGRGGLAPSPDQPLSPDVVWSDTRLPATTAQQQTQEKPAAKLTPKAETVKFVPATGWVFNGKGEVTLISHATPTTESTPASCLEQ